MPRNSTRVPDPDLLTGLVGLYFISLDKDGDNEQQGRVVAALPCGHYLVEIYSWFHGQATHMIVINLDRMAVEYFDAERFIFYRSVEEMCDAADRNRAKHMHQKGQ